MNIAVLSGKGGTGKTTVTSNLAVNVPGCTVIDTDVEEPNLHIFFDFEISQKESIETEYPKINMEKCDLCGKCGDFCRYNAILPAKDRVLVFKEICHNCGGCGIVCPAGAIQYEKREIGKIYSGKSNSMIKMKYGELNIGEMSGVRIIEQIKKSVEEDPIVFIDAPPGTSCATVAAVEEVDYAIIVSEPTPFGVSDMKMVVEMLRSMNIPFGVVVNKAGLGNNEIYEYCRDEKIDILENIPYSRDIAEFYAHGVIFSQNIESYKKLFTNLFQKIKSKLEPIQEGAQ